MVAALALRGIPLALSNPVLELELDAAGRVAGATTLTQQGRRARIGAAKTVLAVNGFGGAPEMVAQYCPEVAAAMYVGARGSQGEAVRWGQRLQARLGNMASYQGYATVIQPHGELLSWTTIEKGGVLVNAAGRRFGDEAVGYSGYTAPVMAQQGPVHAIFDQRIHDIARREPWFRELLDYGGARQAADPGALAQAIGVAPAALQATLDDYNAAAQGHRPDPHGRSDFGIAPLQAPFWFTRVAPALLSTQGGLMIDLDGRVLDRQERPVPNLFAAGGAAAGISGASGGVGYASGSGLLHAIGLGRIAGLAAAREARGQGSGMPDKECR
jgi:fumarate reductase flavoprotein subunit